MTDDVVELLLVINGESSVRRVHTAGNQTHRGKAGTVTCVEELGENGVGQRRGARFLISKVIQLSEDGQRVLEQDIY